MIDSVTLDDIQACKEMLDRYDYALYHRNMAVATDVWVGIKAELYKRTGQKVSDECKHLRYYGINIRHNKNVQSGNMIDLDALEAATRIKIERPPSFNRHDWWNQGRKY